MTTTLDDLIQLMATLRSPEGCPWDREQTHQTLKSYVVEEAYEVLDAIDSGDLGELREELGDLLFQIVFQAQLANEVQAFSLYDVIETIHSKMVRRHPHVFGDVNAETAGDVEKNWEQLKAVEGKSRFGNIPRQLPALLKALRVSEKAAKVGFDWPDAAGPRAKIDEELAELDEAVANADQSAIEEELGDLMFATVNWARKLKLNPEEMLNKASAKFVRRFEALERDASKSGRDLNQLSLDEMEALWQKGKRP